MCCKGWKKDRSIVVCKGDKGNCVVLLKKEDFLSELEELLSDTRKFCLLKNDPTIKRENKLIHLLLKLKKEGTINDSLYDIKYDSRSQSARLYGLPKISINVTILPINMLFSKILQLQTSELASSEFASILALHTTNTFTIKSTFDFVDEINRLPLNLLQFWRGESLYLHPVRWNH